MAAVIFAVALGVMTALRRGRLGRLLQALGDSPVELEAQGRSVDLTRLAVFSISAFFAGIGGALLVSQLNFLDAPPFDSMNSLIIIAVLLTLRVGDGVSSLLAAAAFVVVPSFLPGRGPVWWLDIGLGALAIMSAVTGAAPWLPRWRWAARSEIENGAGKTTTFNFCSRLVHPVRGRLLLHGHDITHLSPSAGPGKGSVGLSNW